MAKTLYNIRLMCGVFVLLAIPCTLCGQTQYVLTALPMSEAAGINNLGTVVGCSWVNNRETATVWDEGNIITLERSDGIIYSHAYAINDAGQVAVSVGYYEPPYYVDPFRAGLWDLPTRDLQVFGTLGGDDSYAYDVNAGGQVVGGAYMYPEDYVSRQACMFVGADAQSLNIPPDSNGRYRNSAVAINDQGQVVCVNSYNQGKLWDGGTITGLWSNPRDINNGGQVVGGDDSAWVWQNGAGQYLPALGPFEIFVDDPEWPGSGWNETVSGNSAHGINIHGQIVGSSKVVEGGVVMEDGLIHWAEIKDHAVIWENDQTVDLNTCIINGGDYVLEKAHAINDRGQILVEAGERFSEGPTYQLLLSPAVMPDVIGPGHFQFVEVPSSNWYDPPLAEGFTFRMTDGSLFTKILDFPSGFGDFLHPWFIVEAGGEIYFGIPGTSVDFGDGVSEFTISGIAPPVDADDPTGFPIKLEFNNPTASFDMIAILIPEPTGLPLLFFGVCTLVTLRFMLS